MSIAMKEEIRRRMARRKSMLEVIQGKGRISVPEASRQFDLHLLGSKAAAMTPSTVWSNGASSRSKNNAYIATVSKT